MRDLHHDEGFLRDFNQASKNWSWATWHQAEAQREAVARRLLNSVFGASPSEQGPASEQDGESAD